MEFCITCPGKHIINCWDKRVNRKVGQFEDYRKSATQGSEYEGHLPGSTEAPQESMWTNEI